MRQAQNSPELLLSFDAVARRLAISKRGVYRLLANEAAFPRPVKIGGSPRISERELGDYIEAVKARRRKVRL